MNIETCMENFSYAYIYVPCKFTAQVKCTRKSKLKTKSNKVFYPLRRKNYDILIKSQPYNTILLILMVVPDNVEEWIIADKFSTIVRQCCYWFCLQNCSESKLQHEDSKEHILLEENSLLTPETFPILMQSIADGEM